VQTLHFELLALTRQNGGIPEEIGAPGTGVVFPLVFTFAQETLDVSDHLTVHTLLFAVTDGEEYVMTFPRTLGEVAVAGHTAPQSMQVVP
jgi:hypothetical protein